MKILFEKKVYKEGIKILNSVEETALSIELSEIIQHSSSKLKNTAKEIVSASICDPYISLCLDNGDLALILFDYNKAYRKPNHTIRYISAKTPAVTSSFCSTL